MFIDLGRLQVRILARNAIVSLSLLLTFMPEICLGDELSYRLNDISPKFDAAMLGTDRDILGIRLGDKLSDTEVSLEEMGFSDCRTEHESQSVTIPNGIHAGSYSTESYSIFISCDNPSLANGVFDNITLLATSPATGSRIWYISRLQNFEDIENSPDARKIQIALQDKYNCEYSLNKSNQDFLECLHVLDMNGNSIHNTDIFSLKSGKEMRRVLRRLDVGYVFNSFIGLHGNLKSRAKSYSVRLSNPLLSVADKAALEYLNKEFLEKYDGVQATPKSAPLDTPKL